MISEIDNESNEVINSASRIAFYINELKHTGGKIVFAENSGWDLNKIKEKLTNLDDGLIEFISLNPNNLFDISRGKGYNELLLINLTIEQSKFIQEAKAFVKVTGRYPIYNIKYFIDQATRLIKSKGVDIFIDIKDHKLYDWLRLGWNGHSADVRLFASTVSYYKKNIGSRYKELNDYDGHLLEGLCYNIVMARSANMVCRFKKEPVFGGLEGSNIDAFIFSKNQNSLKGKIKRWIGNFIRRFLPFFWF